MPYVKQQKDAFRLVLNKYELNTGAALSKVLKVSIPTALKKIKDPKYFTVGEIDRIVTHGHVPKQEVWDALRQR